MNTQYRTIIVIALISLTLLLKLGDLNGLAEHKVLRDPQIPQTISITYSGNSIILNWSPSQEATSYKVYSSEFPDSGFSEDSSGIYSDNSWSAPISEQKKFYYVTAISDDVNDRMVYVQGGTFQTGSATVTLSSYYIDKYETTQGDWTNAYGYNPVEGISWPVITDIGNQYPMFYITWYDAVKFCNRKSLSENLSPVYSYFRYGIDYGSDPDFWPRDWDASHSYQQNVICNWTAAGYRLPTEMEWLFAAKGGTHSLGYTYSGSNTVDEVAWYNMNAGGNTHPVGQLGSNELGLFDMSGNVSEIVWDIWGTLPGGTLTDPAGPQSGQNRARRNGGIQNGQSMQNLIWRGSITPSTIGRDLGMRVAQTGNPLPSAATPIFSLPLGFYTSEQTIQISCSTPGAQIYYTLDGSYPTTQTGIYYQNPLAVHEPVMLRAVAYQDNMNPSLEAHGVYNVIRSPVQNFVLVEGGTFNNGSSNVTLSSFWIDRYELTQISFLAVTGRNPSHFIGNSTRAAERISWFDVIEYCNKRSILEGLNPCYSYSANGVNLGTDVESWPQGWSASNVNHQNIICNWNANGYRMPTEMEWLFAAKGGNLSHGYPYSGGNDINSVAWYYNNSQSLGLSSPDYGPHPGGHKTGNELNIFDMTGNLIEWCWDIYGAYSSTDQTNPTGAGTGTYRVCRGGSWVCMDYQSYLHMRGYNPPTVLDFFVGARIARNAQ